MTKEQIIIQPGPIFWAVFTGAMKGKGASVTAWGKERGFAIASLKPMATGGTNGEKSKKIRQEMIAEIGESLFRDLYTAHLRHEGLLP